MIIFTDRYDLIDAISNRLKKYPVIMNMSSARSGLIDATPLITQISRFNNSQMPTNMYIDTLQFDMDYANQLQNNMLMFECMLNMVFRSYNGDLVIVLVGRDPYRDAITESLIKYIQQKYGHMCWIVEDIDDIMCLKETGFTPTGLTIIGEEIKQYDDLYSRGQISQIFDPVCKE